MKILIIICDAIICIMYAIMAKRQNGSVDRKWSIAVSACFGVAFLCNLAAMIMER